MESAANDGRIADGATTFVHAKKRIGGKDAPVNYSFEERVFCPGDTAPDKAAAKLEVMEMLRSRVISAEKPQWNTATSNWDNMQMTGKCYKRTNTNAEVCGRRRFVDMDDLYVKLILAPLCSEIVRTCSRTTSVPRNFLRRTRHTSQNQPASTQVSWRWL